MNNIGIIGAMDEEVDILRDCMDIKETKDIAGLKFYTGKLEGKDVVLVRSGIGKVNAALCAQILISEFDVSAIVNTGVAGAINKELDVFDIVISTDVIHHDFDTSAFGYEIGVIPRMETSIFTANDNILNVAYNSSKDSVNNKVLKGRIVSGDVFVSDAKVKERLEKMGAYCTEMEGAAIGHTAYVNKVPFVIIRSMSDRADGSADVIYNEFVEKAAHNSKDIVLNMLKNL